MKDKMRGAAVWLGLVADDGAYREDIIDEELTEEFELPEEETPSATVTELEPRRARPAETRDMSTIAKINPTSFNDAATIGENVRDGIPVIMNLSDLDDLEARRLVDFAAGLTFGLGGTMERVTNRVFMLTPPTVMIAAEDKQRLAGSFYSES